MMKKRIKAIVFFLIAFVLVDRGIGTILNGGLDRYFGLKQKSEVLLIGHSHLMLSVDKQIFEKNIGKTVSKYCREGVNVADKYQMVKQFLTSSYADSLQVVLYGVDQFMFNGEGLSANSYKLFYPFMDEETIDEYIKQSTDSYDYWLHKVVCSTRYSDALINSSLRGWLHNWSNYKYGTLNVAALKQRVTERKERSITFNPELIDCFEKTLSLLKERNIQVVLVNTPIAAPLNAYEPQQYAQIIHYFHQKAAESPLISYWDLNPTYSKDYSLFFDAIHMNDKGQKVINQCLVEMFNQNFGQQ